MPHTDDQSAVEHTFDSYVDEDRYALLKKQFAWLGYGMPEAFIISTGMTVSDTELSLYQSDTYQINYEIAPENATNKSVYWTSSDENVVTVDQNGLVTATGAGDAEITYRAWCNGYEGTIEVTVSASQVEGIFVIDGVEYTLISETGNIVQITGYTDEISSSISIGSEFRHHGVDYLATSIGNKAFYGCSVLKEVTLSGIDVVGNRAFTNCSALETVTFGDSAVTVDDCAFYKCGALASVNLGNVTSVGSYAFYGCTSIAEADLSSVASVGNRAFAHCESLKTVMFDYSKVSIDDYAFYGCAFTQLNLTKVTSIGYWAFAGNDIHFVVFSNQLTSVDAKAFNGYTFIDSEGQEVEVSVSGLNARMFEGENKVLVEPGEF